MANQTEGFWTKVRRSVYLSSQDVGIELPTDHCDVVLEDKPAAVKQEVGLTVFAEYIHNLLDGQITKK